MASTPPKTTGDAPIPARPVISYAQAAKGRSASVPTKTAPVAPSDASRKESAATSTAPTTVSSTSAASPAEERHAPTWRREHDGPSGRETAAAPAASSAAEPRSKGTSISPLRAAPRSSMTAASSPTLGARSTSTTAKDDDAQSLPNASSDSAWDQRSQWSTAADEGVADKERQGSRDGSIRGPAPFLVAAPVPAVNVWQQRLEAQAAKARAAAQTSTTGPTGARAATAPDVRPSRDGPATGSVPERATAPEAPSDPSTSPRPRTSLDGRGGGDEARAAGRAAHDGDRHPEARTSPGTDRRREEGRWSHRTSGHARGSPDDRSGAFSKPLPRTRHDQDRATGAPPGPPPVADEESWPTPDTAKDGGKRKAPERSERTDKDRGPGGNAKPHGKEKWTPVPYTPSVVFETQVAVAKTNHNGKTARGGPTGRRGGGTTPNGSMRGEKGPAGSSHPTARTVPDEVAGRDRGRGEMPPPAPSAPSAPSAPPAPLAPLAPPAPPASPAPKVDSPKVASPKTVSTPDHTPKRAVSAGPHGHPEQRRPAPHGSPERRRESDISPKTSERRWTGPGRRTSSATQTDSVHRPRPEPRWNGRGDAGFVPGPMMMIASDRTRSSGHETYRPHRASFSDRRGDGPHRGPDVGRDGSWHGAGRERGEGRMDRLRGGFRGGLRGGHHHNHHHANHHNGGYGGYGGGGGSSHPPPASFSNGQHVSAGSTHASAVVAAFGPSHHHPPRHGRQSSLNQPGTSITRSRSQRRHSRSPPRTSHGGLGRYASMPGNQPMSQLQTQQLGPMYEHPPLHAMTAVPYAPFMEHYAVWSMVSVQMEYYFSVDNLCKDLFLRRHMDSYGFVFLNVIANFNRIRQLTQDMDMLRSACFQSQTIELYYGTDGLDRVRRREGWQQWVLAQEERDPSVRDDDRSHPVFLTGPPMATVEAPSTASQGRSIASVETGSDEATERGRAVETNGGPPPVVPRVDTTAVNGTTNGNPAAMPHAPLSATVAEFSPLGPVAALPHESPTADQTGMDVFSDEQVDCLMIFVGDRDRPTMPRVRRPAGVRSFSNGSIDEKTIAEALEPASGPGDAPRPDLAPLASERRASASHATSPSPGGSASRVSVSETASPVIFWMKGCEAPLESIPDGLSCRYYKEQRQLGLDDRSLATAAGCPQEMENLYEFWSHFLIRNFNRRMYEEFRMLAIEDRRRRSCEVGVRCLVRYYDASLHSQTTVADRIARDYVDLVEGEGDQQDPIAFTRLRSAWRNGALNLKNRKKMDNALSPALRTRLDL